MNLSKLFVSVVFIGVIILSGCSQKQKINCNSVSSSTVKVLCKQVGVSQQYNIETGQNEYKPRFYCYAYPSGEIGITYRVWSYDNQGQELKGGDAVAGGSVEIAVNAAYVDAWPNLDGVFCKNKLTKVMRSEFTGLK